MQELFLQIINMSITASYVIIAILIFRLLLKKAPKKYSYLLWGVAAFRLVCPVSFSSIVSIFKLTPFDMSVALQNAENKLNYIPSNIGYMAEPKVSVGIPVMNSYISGGLPRATPYSSINPIQVWIFIGTVIWCVGMASLIIYSMLEYLRIRKRMSTAVRMKANVFATDKIYSPFILGLLIPRIYIPFGLNRSERAYILRHEFYHIKRKDHLVKIISFLVLTLHWFNPLVWIAYYSMTKDMEMSCDEKVLAKNKNISKQYSMSLLSFATRKKRLLASPLSFGEGGISERVKNVLKFRKYPKGVILFIVAICATIIVACAANPKINVVSKEVKDLYGSYALEKSIYMNPVSSFTYIGVKEYYYISENSFIKVELNNIEEQTVTYQKTEVKEEEFNSSFLFDFGIPDISTYKIRNQYTLIGINGYSFYRIYEMDDEIWLAKINLDRKQDNKEMIGSILKLTKINVEIPEEVTLSGTDVGTEEFEGIFGDNKSTLSEGDICYNVTPETIRNNSAFEIFKYSKSCASFLLYEDNFYPLGIWFGGIGLTSVELADVNGDGLEELYFTNSWGSGLHRSQAGYFDPATKEVVTFEYSYLNEELILGKNNEGTISLYAATLGELTDFAHFSLKGKAFVSDIVYVNDKIALDLQVRD